MVGDYYQNHELKYPMIVKIIKDLVNNKLKFLPFLYNSIFLPITSSSV